MRTAEKAIMLGWLWKKYSVFNKNYYDYTCVDHSAAIFYFIFTLNIHSDRDTLFPEAFFYSYLANFAMRTASFIYLFFVGMNRWEPISASRRKFPNKTR